VKRWVRRLAALSFAIVALGVLAPGIALADCPPLDVVCLADETLGGGGGGVPVDLPPLPDDDPIDDVVDPIDDVVPPVVKDPIDRIRGLLDDPPVDPPIGGGGGGGGSHEGPGGAGNGTSRPGGRSDAPPRPREVLTGPRASRLGISSTSLERSGPPAPVERDPAIGERLGQVLAVAARSLALVLALLGLAALFAVIQDRLDRKDPRLALAPIESDVVTFG
jgi:hypothetical protein